MFQFLIFYGNRPLEIFSGDKDISYSTFTMWTWWYIAEVRAEWSALPFLEGGGGRKGSLH